MARYCSPAQLASSSPLDSSSLAGALAPADDRRLFLAFAVCGEIALYCSSPQLSSSSSLDSSSSLAPAPAPADDRRLFLAFSAVC
eukprot:619904-Hanusia_phi.AAC.1